MASGWAAYAANVMAGSPQITGAALYSKAAPYGVWGSSGTVPAFSAADLAILAGPIKAADNPRVQGLTFVREVDSGNPKGFAFWATSGKGGIAVSYCNTCFIVAAFKNPGIEPRAVPDLIAKCAGNSLVAAGY